MDLFSHLPREGRIVVLGIIALTVLALYMWARAFQRLRREEAGMAIPQQMSVVGFDDLRWARLLTPALTTVHQPQVSQGEIAMQMLVDMMAGREVRSRILQPRLMIRGSTGPAPVCEEADPLARAQGDAHSQSSANG